MCNIDFSAVSYISYITFPSLAILFLLGFSVLFANFKGRFNRLYFFIIISIIIWIFSDYLGYKLTNPQYVIWTERSSTLGLVGVALVTLLLYIFPENELKKISKKILILIFLPLIIFLAIVPTKLYVKEIGPFPDCATVTGPFFWFMVLLIVYYIFLGSIFAIKKFKNLKDNHRKQIKIVAIGSFISFLLVILIDIIPTLYGADWIVLFSPYVALTFASFYAYAIVKYKAFDIKLITAQALVATLIVLIGSQFFFIQNNTNRILVGITMVLSLVFGYFLIESVMNEIKRKEELQMMSSKLAQANDQLVKLDNAKSEFISIASHQLRTPLTAIKGFISLLLEGSYGKVEAKQEDVLNKVYSSNDRLIKLVEDLLNVSRMESGRMQFDLKPTDMKDICKEIIDTFYIRAKDAKLSLEYKPTEEELPKVMVDGIKMKEVISNLVDNAIKYCPKGGVSLKVELSENSKFQIPNDKSNSNVQNPKFGEGGVVRITVSDTGIGIPQEELPYLFGKFSRGKDISRLNTSGTGLGLYVGKAIVEANGSRIWAESDGEGKGSRFIVEIPVVQSEEILKKWS